jgi:hypothetical protein
MTWERAADAVIDAFARRFDLVDGRLDAEVAERARSLAARHRADA